MRPTKMLSDFELGSAFSEEEGYSERGLLAVMELFGAIREHQKEVPVPETLAQDKRSIRRFKLTGKRARKFIVKYQERLDQGMDVKTISETENVATTTLYRYLRQGKLQARKQMKKHLSAVARQNFRLRTED